MTTDRRSLIPRWTLGAVAALAVWFAGLAAVALLAEPTSSVIVFARDPADVARAVAGSDVAMLRGSDRALVVTGRSPRFVAQLYASGAWLVLPYRGGGCLALSRPATATRTPPPNAAQRSG